MAEHRLERNRDHIVDGYNLMHALGVVRNGMPQKAFEVAREEFLAELRRQWTGPGHLLICLDGHASAAISGPHGGLVHSRHFETRYSHRQTADDMILSLIAGEKRPAGLVIVSGDSDITVEARRKGCAIAGCVDWYASLTETAPASIPSRTIEDKPTTSLPGTEELKALWTPDVERQQVEAQALPKPAKPTILKPRENALDTMTREAKALADAVSVRQTDPAPASIASQAPKAVPPRVADDPFEAMKEQARALLRQTAREATAPRPDTPRPLKGAVDPGKPVGDIGGMGVPDDLIEECRKIMEEEGGGPPRGRSGAL